MNRSSINFTRPVALVALICCICFQAKALSEKILVDGMYYIFSGNTATVTFSEEGDVKISNKADYEGDVVIPSTVSYGNTVYTVTAIGGCAFDGCKQLSSVEIPSTVTSIGVASFAQCIKLKEINLPHSLQAIASYAFRGCTGLTSVIIPEAVMEVKGFDDCTGLTSVKLPSKAISVSGFNGCSALTAIEIPGSVRSVGDFNDCTNLRNITLPASLESIGSFQNCTALSEITVPEGITAVGEKMFSGCSGLRKVVLPEGITSIEYNAFEGCKGLQTIQLPASLKRVGRCAFNRSGLRQFVAPAGLEAICYYAFNQCAGLLDVQLNSTLTTMESKAFYECTSLRKITIPESITKIEDGVFWGCSNLSTINIPATVKEYGASAFGGTAITTMHIPEQMSSIPDALFCYCQNLSSIIIPENITSIGARAFERCVGLKEIVLPPNVTKIGKNAFEETRFESITIPAKVSFIGEETFAGNSSLKEITFHGDICEFGEKVFKGCTSLSKIELPKLINEIPGSMFWDCQALRKLTIPETVTSVGSWAFYGTGITSIIIPNAVTSIETYAFEKSKLREVVLGKSVNNIGYQAFTGVNLEKVVSFSQFPPITESSFSFSFYTPKSLYVPAASLDYYREDDVWGRFSPIEAVHTVSSVTAEDISGVSKESGVVKLHIEPEGYVPNTIRFDVENREIVNIDWDGSYTLGTVDGETLVHVVMTTGEDNHEIFTSFKVSARTIPVETIDISGEQNEIKQYHWMELTATVSPSNATNPEIKWISSDEGIATVDQKGVVTAVSGGDVKIYAYATDGSGIYGVYELKVIPIKNGDINESGLVTVSDAVRIAETAKYSTPSRLYPQADIDLDGVISASDAFATVDIALEENLSSLGNGGSGRHAKLVIGDTTAEIGDEVTLAARLETDRDFKAFQADITVPEGMSLVDVRPGNRVASSHSLFIRRIDRRSMRVILFDINSPVFDNSDEALLKIEVKADETATGNIEVNHVLGETTSGTDFKLPAIGGRISEVSGVGAVEAEEFHIETAPAAILISNASGQEIKIYDLAGVMLSGFTAASASERIAVNSGVYIVAIGNLIEKVIVK